jgi:hypothetical protein
MELVMVGISLIRDINAEGPEYLDPPLPGTGLEALPSNPTLIRVG